MIKRLNALVQEKIDPRDLVFLTETDVQQAAIQTARVIHQRAIEAETMLNSIIDGTADKSVWSQVARGVVK